MAQEEKILTLHPQGKQGVNISKLKYDQVKEVVLNVIKEKDNITFSDMIDIANDILVSQRFDGKPMWYITSVKLDLEARGVIVRVLKTSPHQLRFVKD